MVEFNQNGFTIHGEKNFYSSAEFPYFRVPRSDWKKRLKLLVQSGCNCVATYVPWIVHEPEDGKILFGDTPQRDLAGFLEICKTMNLPVMLRPGPYQYSEMVCSGIPRWLYDNYPEVMARNQKGEIYCSESFSYVHPLFLERTERYITAVIDVARPYLEQNGGTVCMIQLDNELFGAQIWHGSIDYNAESMGFGKETGRYTVFLKEKYKNIDSLNEAYGCHAQSFAEIRPTDLTGNEPENARRQEDYWDFYLGTGAEYCMLLQNMYEKNGVNCLFAHNASSTHDVPLFTKLMKKQNDNFLLGLDSYYTLGIHWPQNNVTPQFYIKEMLGADLLHTLGMPPSVLEMAGGSPSDVPPILPEDLTTHYMIHLALGYKGYNFYIFTGGENIPGTGITTDIYDYNAFIHADGTKNPTYNALKKFGKFLNEHKWLADVERKTTVQIGIERNWISDPPRLDSVRESFYESRTSRRIGLALALACSPYSPCNVELTEEQDINKPLLIATWEVMSKAAQKNVLQFIKQGGKVMLFGMLPRLDENFNECTILADALGGVEYDTVPDREVYSVINSHRIYCFDMPLRRCLKNIPASCDVIATSASGEHALGMKKQIDKGEVIYFCNTFETHTFKVVEMLESLLDNVKAQKTVKSTNRNIFTQLYITQNHRGVFVMNLYTGRQTTDLVVFDNGEEIEIKDLKLKPMEVRFIEF